MGGSYYPIPCSILSTRKDRKTPQRYLNVPTTSWRISIRSMDSFQGLTTKSPSSWHRPLAPTNKITTSCEICSGPHDTRYCMEDPEHAFVEYASSYTDEAGDARLSKFKANFKQQQSEMTNKIDTMFKAISDRIAGTLPRDMVKNLKLSTYPVLSARSYPTEDPQCLTQTYGLIYAITIHTEQQSASYNNEEKENKKEEDNLENIHVDPPTPPDPFITFITEKDDGDVMFIEIILKDDNSRKEEPEVEGQEVEYFDIFSTRSELAYHKSIYRPYGLVNSSTGEPFVEYQHDSRRPTRRRVIFDEKKLEAVLRKFHWKFWVTILTSRKAHLLEDKQIPSVGVFDEVLSIWKAFRGNTRDLGSFGEETDKTMNLHQHLLRISTQKLLTTSQITRDAITSHLKMASQDLQAVSECTIQPII
ncbi:hypothetical protein Tco_1211117 [Tanacetum coccineum]